MKYFLLIMLASSGFYLEASNFEGDSSSDEEETPPSSRPARIIGAELMERFRNTELTQKDAKRFYDETNQVVGKNFKVGCITGEDAELFCTTNRKEIMQTAQDLLVSPEFIYLASLENSLAALWFLSRCDNIRTAFGLFKDEELESVESLMKQLIDNPDHIAILTRWIAAAEKNSGTKDRRENGIRAARLIALFSTNTAAKKTANEKYAMLSQGEDELSLDYYIKNYPADHEKRSSQSSKAHNSGGRKTLANDSDDKSSSDDESDSEDIAMNPKHTRSGFSFRRLLPWGAMVLGVFTLAVGGALAYQKYGTKKPQPKVKG